ncbi:MAG: PH domain-containing protein [Anaerolineales bacterium]|nr:PH domain-containing protein [Anaerolineales bacterium]
MVGNVSGMWGHASEISPEEAQKDYQDILIDNEEVKAAFLLIRDVFMFTNKRFILIDVQGVTGKKVEYLSIPYKSIRYFSVETAGTFDRDAEFKIWVGGGEGPAVVKEIKKGFDIIGLQNTLASFILD